MLPRVLGVITLRHCETNTLKFTDLFFRFRTTHCGLWALRLLHSTDCKIIARLARTYGILADLIKNVYVT